MKTYFRSIFILIGFINCYSDLLGQVRIDGYNYIVSTIPDSKCEKYLIDFFSSLNTDIEITSDIFGQFEYFKILIKNRCHLRQNYSDLECLEYAQSIAKLLIGESNKSLSLIKIHKKRGLDFKVEDYQLINNEWQGSYFGYDNLWRCTFKSKRKSKIKYITFMLLSNNEDTNVHRVVFFNWNKPSR